MARRRRRFFREFFCEFFTCFPAIWGEPELTEAEATASTIRAMGPPIERSAFIEPTARPKNPCFCPTPMAR